MNRHNEMPRAAHRGSPRRTPSTLRRALRGVRQRLSYTSPRMARGGPPVLIRTPASPDYRYGLVACGQKVGKGIEKAAKELSTSLTKVGGDVNATLLKVNEDTNITLLKVNEDTNDSLRKASEDINDTVRKASEDINATVTQVGNKASEDINATVTQVGNNFNDTLNNIGNRFIAGIECALIFAIHFGFFATILLLCVAAPEAGYLSRSLFLLSFVVATVACSVWASKIMRSATQSRKLAE